MTRTMHRLWERVAFPIADGIADGSIRPCDPSIAAQVVNSTIDAASELDRWAKDIDAAGAQANYVYPLAGLYAPPGWKRGHARRAPSVSGRRTAHAVPARILDAVGLASRRLRWTRRRSGHWERRPAPAPAVRD